ncbi:MAG: MATE family efflux transporter, partial [Ruminococcus flavefaciens]|nr:MATE family efflux transporter [Ruminococcus flavefaciens]
MPFFTEYKPYYKNNLRLALPVILSQLGQITVQLADTAMVGRYGGDDPTPLAAVSFGTSIFYIIFIAAMGLTFGLTPLVGEHFARGDKRYASELLQNGALLFTLTGIVAAAALVAARPLMTFMGGAMMDSGGDTSIADVIATALPYYDTLIWSMPPVMIFCTFKQFLEGIGNTRTTMAVIIACNAVNVILNWILIFGKCGFEPMGAVGAGISTLVARICMCLMITVYFFRSRRFGEYAAHLRMGAFRLRTAMDILKVGIPISFQMFMEASAFVVANIMVLAFGAHASSSYQIGVNMMNLTFMIVVAIGSATTILCSHIYGQGDFSRLRRTVNASYQLGLMWCMTAAACFVLLRYDIPSLFTTNRQVIDLTATMLVYIALFQASDCLQSISISILRGLQDVKIIMPIVFLSYVVINIPVGYLLAFRLGLGAAGLIMGLIAGLSCCAVLTIRRVRRNIIRL